MKSNIWAFESCRIWFLNLSINLMLWEEKASTIRKGKLFKFCFSADNHLIDETGTFSHFPDTFALQKDQWITKDCIEFPMNSRCLWRIFGILKGLNNLWPMWNPSSKSILIPCGFLRWPRILKNSLVILGAFEFLNSWSSQESLGNVGSIFCYDDGIQYP